MMQLWVDSRFSSNPIWPFAHMHTFLILFNPPLTPTRSSVQSPVPLCFFPSLLNCSPRKLQRWVIGEIAINSRNKLINLSHSFALNCGLVDWLGLVHIHRHSYWFVISIRLHGTIAAAAPSEEKEKNQISLLNVVPVFVVSLVYKLWTTISMHTDTHEPRTIIGQWRIFIYYRRPHRSLDLVIAINYPDDTNNVLLLSSCGGTNQFS